MVAAAGEIAGTCLGFIGGILLAAGGAQEGEVSGLQSASPPATSAHCATLVLDSLRCARCLRFQVALADPTQRTLKLPCSCLGCCSLACLSPIYSMRKVLLLLSLQVTIFGDLSCVVSHWAPAFLCCFHSSWWKSHEKVMRRQQ